MDHAIEEIVRAILAHSECVALFVILVLQSFAMHQINVKKFDAQRRDLRKLVAKLFPEDEDDAPNGR